MARNFIYTNKKQSVKGIMSSFFGALSTISYVLCIYKSYLTRGEDVTRYSTVSFFATIFMIVGFLLFVWSTFETDTFWLFRIIGVVLNIMALIALSTIFYAGAILG